MFANAKYFVGSMAVVPLLSFVKRPPPQNLHLSALADGLYHPKTIQI
jgi:hypothetical protein